MDYNSMLDTQNHINKIQFIMGEKIIPMLRSRALYHDRSKFEEPEKSTYDKYIPLLKNVKYGSDEYNEIRNKMHEEGLQHHYNENRHHPEHFEKGINDMTLVDIVEMFCDWKASSMRHHDGNLLKSIDINASRFNMTSQLKQIFINTAKMYDEQQ